MKASKISKYGLYPMVFLLFLLSGCMKDFLDVKRDKSQVTPESLSDFRALLDDNGYMNYNFPSQLAIIGADEYFVTDGQWEALTSPIGKNAYIWNDEIYEGNTGDDWNRGYEKVMFANFVIEGVSKIAETVENKDLRNELLGEAHFYRVISYFMMVQLFCKQYVEKDAAFELGLPLRTSSNINVHYQRATLEETYSFILKDIAQAIQLLPLETLANTRPNKTAGLTLGAMISMQMGKFDEGMVWAEQAFKHNNQLLDYNTVDVYAQNPFSQYGRDNIEILFYAQVINNTIFANSRLNVVKELYDSYEDNDLRKKAFFRVDGDRIIYKGGYMGGTTNMFIGVTTAELYLLMAEFMLRIDGGVEQSVKYLNAFLKNRIIKTDFEQIPTSISTDECQRLIMSERRKELIFRARRWWDLKRYNENGVILKPLQRVIRDNTYSLPLKSNKWVWPIPPDVIAISGLEQNKR